MSFLLGGLNTKLQRRLSPSGSLELVTEVETEFELRDSFHNWKPVRTEVSSDLHTYNEVPIVIAIVTRPLGETGQQNIYVLSVTFCFLFFLQMAICFVQAKVGSHKISLRKRGEVS